MTELSVFVKTPLPGIRGQLERLATAYDVRCVGGGEDPPWTFELSGDSAAVNRCLADLWHGERPEHWWRR